MCKGDGVSSWQLGIRVTTGVVGLAVSRLGKHESQRHSASHSRSEHTTLGFEISRGLLANCSKAAYAQPTDPRVCFPGRHAQELVGVPHGDYSCNPKRTSSHATGSADSSCGPHKGVGCTLARARDAICNSHLLLHSHVSLTGTSALPPRVDRGLIRFISSKTPQNGDRVHAAQAVSTSRSPSETGAVAKLVKRTATRCRRPKVNLWARHREVGTLSWHAGQDCRHE